MEGAVIEALWPNATLHQRSIVVRLFQAARAGSLCIREQNFFDELPAGIVREADRLYLHRNWVLETQIIQHIRRLLQAKPNDLDPSKYVVSPTLLAAQAAAVQAALHQSLVVISGGPGTGKTFTAKEMIASISEAAIRLPLRVCIAAPTGKAADRLAQGISASERLEVKVMTLHRLLRLRPRKHRFFEPVEIEADVVLVDEASMMDASLFAHLLAAIPSGARLILLGDAGQLPPIHGSSLFQHLPAYELTSCVRVKDNALQQIFAEVRQGGCKQLAALLEPLDQRSWHYPHAIYKEKPDPAALFSYFDRLRWICPLRKGSSGVDAINACLLQQLQGKLFLGDWWAIPLLLDENDRGLQLYNGTPAVAIGQFRGKDVLQQVEAVHFADGRSFSLEQLPRFELAFAISAHKSQGSEYEEVLVWLPPGSEEFGREALYTALTRAKRTVRCMGEQATLEQIVMKSVQHDSGLKEVAFTF